MRTRRTFHGTLCFTNRAVDLVRERLGPVARDEVGLDRPGGFGWQHELGDGGQDCLGADNDDSDAAMICQHVSKGRNSVLPAEIDRIVSPLAESPS